jgi:hypothetical protein
LKQQPIPDSAVAGRVAVAVATPVGLLEGLNQVVPMSRERLDQVSASLEVLHTEAHTSNLVHPGEAVENSVCILYR